MINNWRASAKFSQEGGYVFRTETILSTFEGPINESHKHLFSIIMFNPGSSMPKELSLNDLRTNCTIDQTMGKIIRWTELTSKDSDLSNSFITIYNLFNLVNADINTAKVQAELSSSSFIKEIINFNQHSMPKFIWKAWGKYPETTFFKNRVNEIEKMIIDSGISTIGDNNPSLNNYHPSYLNRSLFRRDLIIEEMRKRLNL